jgi:hypothetical protein
MLNSKVGGGIATAEDGKATVEDGIVTAEDGISTADDRVATVVDGIGTWRWSNNGGCRIVMVEVVQRRSIWNSDCGGRKKRPWRWNSRGGGWK